MSTLDAVAHPVRLKIIRRLSDHGPASLAELAKDAGVHENTARVHVAALEKGGIITSERRPLDRPGRPGINFRLADSALLAPSGLAQLLAAALERSGASAEVLRSTGREWGRYLTGRPGSHELVEKLPQVLEQLGYTARVMPDAVELGRCPCDAVAPGDPRLVCCLAEGVVAGVLDASGGAWRLGSAEHDPERRRCRIELVEVAGR